MDVSFAPTSQLGTPSAHEYRAGWGVWLYGFFGALLAFAGFAGLVNMITTGIFNSVQLVVSLAGLLVAAFFAYLCYSGFTTRAQVYEHGLSYTRRNTTSTIRWDEVEAIWQHVMTYRVRVLIFYIPVKTAHKYVIRKKLTGETITLNDTLGNVGELGDHIQDHVLRHMLPGAIETYNNGGTLEFGKLSISQIGISNSKETIPWEQVSGVRIAEGHIIVKKTGKWLRWAGADVGKTPNVFLFITMIDRIVGINR
jgi:hypothetical protein